MGKIRVSTLGDTEAEQKQKEEAKKRRLAKKLAKEGPKAASSSEEKKENKKVVKETKKVEAPAKKEVKEETKKGKTKTKIAVPHVRSSRYKELRSLVDPRKLYVLSEAVDLAKKTAKTKFTGSVEAHFNLSRVLKIKNADGVKVERKTPLAHAKLGKTSDTPDTLKSSFENVVKTLGRPNIKKVVLNATMGPGIKVQLAE